jgi:hypothetical protein
MCTFIFYLASRNHSKLKLDLNSNEIANYKGFQKLERNFFSLFGFGPKPHLIPMSGLADSPLPSLPRGPAKAL